MAEIESCPECNVPKQFVDNHVWLRATTEATAWP
jgi:hypothetical protein